MWASLLLQSLSYPNLSPTASIQTELQSLRVCICIHAHAYPTLLLYLLLHSAWNALAFSFYMSKSVCSSNPVPWTFFWTLNRQHTHIPHTKSHHSFYLPLFFFYFLLDFCLFPPLIKDQTIFCFSSLFPLCIFDNTDVTIIWIISFTCYSYFTIKWWETQRLLDKCITRKQETWQIIEA